MRNGSAMKSGYKFTCFPSFIYNRSNFKARQLNLGVELLAFYELQAVNHTKRVVTSVTKDINTNHFSPYLKNLILVSCFATAFEHPPGPSVNI